MKKTILLWLKGLASAGIGGFATAISTSVVAPETFNLTEGLNKLIMVSSVSALISVATYLKQSPLPEAKEDAPKG